MIETVSSVTFRRVRSQILDKYSVGLYFKSWLIQHDNGEEHVRLHLPTAKTGGLISDGLTEGRERSG